jgi:hypothetical protein
MLSDSRDNPAIPRPFPLCLKTHGPKLAHIAIRSVVACFKSASRRQCRFGRLNPVEGCLGLAVRIESDSVVLVDFSAESETPGSLARSQSTVSGNGASIRNKQCWRPISGA